MNALKIVGMVLGILSAFVAIASPAVVTIIAFASVKSELEHMKRERQEERVEFRSLSDKVDRTHDILIELKSQRGDFERRILALESKVMGDAPR